MFESNGRLTNFFIINIPCGSRVGGYDRGPSKVGSREKRVKSVVVMGRFLAQMTIGNDISASTGNAPLVPCVVMLVKKLLKWLNDLNDVNPL